MKRLPKVLILLSLIICSCTFMACSDDDLTGFANGFFDGADAAANGFTLIGYASSESECSSMCGVYGYTLYRYNYNTTLCYCK